MVRAPPAIRYSAVTATPISRTGDMITIVSGLPRSGTSMMMRILEAGGMPVLTDGVRAADVDNPNGYYEFEPAKTTREDPSWLTQAECKAVKMVYKLLFDLPPDRTYQVIFIQRTLTEVIASQNRMLARMGQGTTGVVADRAWVTGFAAEIAATRAWLRARPCFRVLFINYNRLLSAPADPLTSVNTFLGGHLDKTAMRAAIDPRLYRQRM